MVLSSSCSVKDGVERTTACRYVAKTQIIPESFDEMSHQGKVEVVCERQADAVVELVEVPLEWFPGLQHDHVQGGVGVVEGPLTLEGEEVLLKKSQTGSVKRYLVQLEDAEKRKGKVVQSD